MSATDNKRPRGSPTGETPIQVHKRRPQLREGRPSRRNLCRDYQAAEGTVAERVPHTAWSVSEMEALVGFRGENVGLHQRIMPLGLKHHYL